MQEVDEQWPREGGWVEKFLTRLHASWKLSMSNKPSKARAELTESITGLTSPKLPAYEPREHSLFTRDEAEELHYTL